MYQESSCFIELRMAVNARDVCNR